MQDIKKIKKAEDNFISFIQKTYRNHPEWSLDDFKSIYNSFINFCNKIKSEPISLLRVAEVQLKDDCNILNKILKYSLKEKQWYIFSILTTEDIHISMKIALVGAICKLTIDNPTK